MKVLLINGSPHEHGCTDAALGEVAAALQQRGIETEMAYLGTKPVPGCIACGHCSKTGRCVYDDQVNALGARLDEFQGIVLGSPVYYAGPTGTICSFLDRFFHANGGKFAGKVGASVVSCRRGGASAAFDRLNKYFTITNMNVAGSQYWNQVHGMKAEDVSRDVEGVQTMHALAENMAWLMKCAEAGRAAGVEAPVYEKKQATNFIR